VGGTYNLCNKKSSDFGPSLNSIYLLLLYQHQGQQSNKKLFLGDQGPGNKKGSEIASNLNLFVLYVNYSSKLSANQIKNKLVFAFLPQDPASIRLSWFLRGLEQKIA